MNFPKKQAQRLIPEYLLDYTEKLQNSHPDPTESWGGSGGSYTSGDGIDITNNVISVDDTIAKKSEIPSREKSPFLGVRQTTDGTVLFSETGQDDDYYSVYHVTEPVKVNLRALNPKFGNGLTSSYNTSTRALDVSVDTTTIAKKSDIPSLDGYATQTWVETQGYSKFSGSYNDLTDKPDLSIYAQSSNLSTVATSGSYNDLNDKPVIPDTTNMVTTNTDQTITGAKTFEGATIVSFHGERTLQICNGSFIHTNNSAATKKEIEFYLPVNKDDQFNYILATTDDIHNPTITFTQGGTTKGTITLNQSGDQTIEFDAGSGGGGGGTPTNMVTTDTNQDITGEKTFVGNKRIKFKQSSQYDRLGFTGYDYEGTEIGYLEMSKRDGDFTGSPISNMLGYWSNVNSAPNPSSDVMLGFKYYTKDSDGNTRDYRLVIPPRYNEIGATRYIPISVNGNTADNTGNINVPTQTLVFTLSDNSTVTVNVMTSATASTTTTS